MSAPRRNPFFRAVIVVGGVFAITVMSMLAAAFGDPQAPPNRFFNTYGMPLILVETLLLVSVSFVALAVDRRQTLADLSRQREAGLPENSTGNDESLSLSDHIEP